MGTAREQGLVRWSPRSVAAFGQAPDVGGHAIHEGGWADDAALVALFERFPREQLHVYTMSDDPTRSDLWREGEVGACTGAQLLDAVHRGRLWVNLVRVAAVDASYGRLVDRLYRELGSVVPGFRPRETSGTLLVSSPSALVHYHADAQPNLLWQLRGRKRVWVYPPLDPRFVDPTAMRQVFAEEAAEVLPYDPAWDADAAVLELAPGQVASWPQNAPHRVVNVEGLNVSLSTEHMTRQTLRRQHVWAANRQLERRVGPRSFDVRETGPRAAAKAFGYRAARKLGVRGTAPYVHERTFVVDPDAPGGWRAHAATPTGR